MQKTRLASVSFLNALPLTWGLSRGRHRGRFDVTFAPPFECARLLQDGLVDIALIPSIEFARSSGLTPVPGTGISSRNEVRSVLLISRRPPATIRTLAVDVNSRTSVALALLVLKLRHRCRPRIEAMPPDLGAMLAAHDAALLIGDAALKASFGEDGAPFAAAGPEPPVVMDLAREWNAVTGMPFVFAFWACRPVIDVNETRDILAASLGEGLASIDRIAAEESDRTGLPARLIASYLRHNIHFRIGAPETASLRVFYRMCREEGLLDRPSAQIIEGAAGPGSLDRSIPLPGTAAGTAALSAPRPRLPRDR